MQAWISQDYINHKAYEIWEGSKSPKEVKDNNYWYRVNADPKLIEEYKALWQRLGELNDYLESLHQDHSKRIDSSCSHTEDIHNPEINNC